MRRLYDSTNINDIPLSAEMVGFYVDGIYETPTSTVRARFPHAVLVPISCVGSNAGVVGDVETGCLSPAGFVQWARERRAAGVTPTAYVNRSNWFAVINACHLAGEPLPPWWLSTLDNSLPWSDGVVAIQYQGERFTGGHYDLSIVQDYWPGIDPRPAPPIPQPLPAIVDDVILFRSDQKGADGNPFIYVIDAAGKRHIGGAEFAARQAAGAKIVDLTAAELGQIPDVGGSRQAAVSGTITLS